MVQRDRLTQAGPCVAAGYYTADRQVDVVAG